MLFDFVGETQYDDPQVQFPRPIPDEVISVYEVYVKEESGPDSRSGDAPSVSGLGSATDQQLIQVINRCESFINENDLRSCKITFKDDCMDLDAAIDSEVINIDGTVTKLLGKDALRYKILEQSVSAPDENVVVYSHPVAEGPSSSTTRLIDKDDPRSRLHFVKYLKRDGKTLKIWECGICSKEFRHQYTLMRHLPTHTDERNFKCEACGKAFRQLSTLSQHKAIHSDARPYVKAHAHADKMQYSCGVCGKEFPRRFALRSHEEYKHGIKYRSTSNAQSAVNEPSSAKSKNVRIIQLFNGDRNQTNENKEKDYFGSSDLMDSIVIDKIETKAMEVALLQGQTPFALYRPVKGIPVLVKVLPTASNKHILTPATAEDLRMAGKITLNPTETSDADGNKAVQVKVPVVATVIQNIEPNGKSSFVIEPPGAEQEQDDLVTALDSQFSLSELHPDEADRQNGANSTPSMDECNELLELAAQGGIQFVRAMEDGRYEVMTSSEARDLMAQNSHDVTILDSEQADAINLVNIRNNGDVIIGDNDNQIMVLESGQKSSSMPMDGIEILEDKDIRILEGKSLDDRFADGITFLSQTKIDDLLLGPKSLVIDSDSALVGHDDAMAVPSSQQDLTSILGHSSNLSTSSQSSLSSLLMKNHPPLSLLNETFPYLKSSQSYADDLNILGVSPGEDHHLEYDPKMRLSSVFDDDCDTGLISFGQSDIKMLDSGNQCIKSFSDKFCLPPPKMFSGLNEVKILGPKNHSHELIAPHYQDNRFLSPFEQFLKNTTMQTSGCISNTADAFEGYRKEVKILGKKLGTGIITTTEEGDIVKVVDDNSKFAGSPCSDFLNFGNRFGGKDMSPDGHLDRSQKDDRGDSFAPGEMLDLD
ncbi:fez family zinc finger protein 2 [Lasius niger]|uniref:Fez family zinc finger protein 2 n=1 Tax=Lasius niger TaxID=67767 RepID=A0A0J7KW36_LASNI|nr:fez family zinc finger protein 2 [Lasius niger]